MCFGKFRTIIAAMLLMLISLSAVMAEGEAAFTKSGEDENISVGAITYSCGNNPLTEILPDKEITASVTVLNEGEDKELIFSLVLYKGNKIIASDTCKKIAASGEETIYSAVLKTPEEVSGTTLSAMLWDSFENMMPIASGSVIPGAEAGIKKLEIDGISAEGFADSIYDYEYPVEASLKTAPNVSAAPIDGGTDCIVKNAEYFPGRAVINAVLYNGDITKYIVKFKNDSSFADSLEYPLTPDDKPTFNKDLQSGKYCFSDKTNMRISYLDDELEGKDYILCPQNWAGTSRLKPIWNGTSQTMLSFKLSRSATVRVLCENLCSVEGSFSEEDGWKKEEEYKIYYKRTYNSNEYKADVMYTKEYKVEDGEQVTVNIPNLGGSASYLIIPDYRY